MDPRVILKMQFLDEMIRKNTSKLKVRGKSYLTVTDVDAVSMAKCYFICVCVRAVPFWPAVVQTAGFPSCEPGHRESNSPQGGLWSHILV